VIKGGSNYSVIHCQKGDKRYCRANKYYIYKYKHTQKRTHIHRRVDYAKEV